MESQKRKELKITCCTFDTSLRNAVSNSDTDLYIKLINTYPEYVSRPLLDRFIEILEFLLTMQTSNTNFIRCAHGKKIPKKVSCRMTELTYSHPVYKCFQHKGMWDAYVEENKQCVNTLMLHANKNNIIIDVPEEIAFSGFVCGDFNEYLERKHALYTRIKFMVNNNINYHLVVNKTTRRLMREYYIDQIHPLIASLIIPDLVGDITRYF